MDKSSLAQSVGFLHPKGNWIAPNGSLLIAESAYDGHTDTICRCCSFQRPEDDLPWKNEKVDGGYIRLLFDDNYVLFQTNLLSIEQLWNNTEQNYMKMLYIIQRIPSVKVHILSKSFYAIGLSQDIVRRNQNAIYITGARDVHRSEPKE